MVFIDNIESKLKYLPPPSVSQNIYKLTFLCAHLYIFFLIIIYGLEMISSLDQIQFLFSQTDWSGSLAH